MTLIRHNNLTFAMGIAFVGWLLVAANGNAQPVRRPREVTTATRLAQQPSLVQQIAAAECRNRAESATAAAAGRVAFLTRNLITAEAAWDRAIDLCALPDRFEGRARTREARQGELDGEERLRLLDGAISDYAQAIERRGLVQGFDSSAIEAALPSLRAARATLDARLHPHVVAARPVVPACGGVDMQTSNTNCGTCGNRCAAGQVCTAGTCRAVATLPVVTPTTPSRVGPVVMIATSVPLLVVGTFYLWKGLEAGSAADIDEATRASHGCNARPVSPQCPNYVPGETTPASIAAWAIPTGAVLLGVGALDAAIGVAWLATTGRPSRERPHVGAWYAPGGGGFTLTGTF